MIKRLLITILTIMIFTGFASTCLADAQIAASLEHIVGLHQNGRVFSTGTNYNIDKSPNTWRDIKYIAASETNTFGIKKDGSVLAIGSNDENQLSVKNWKDIEQIDASKIGLDYIIVGVRNQNI